MLLKEKWSELDANSHLQLVEVMQICDNLFYGDYFQKGGEYKTKEELDKHIKDSLREDFIEFYGEQYADKINDIIDKHRIVFAYQTVGRNSIEEFLNKKEREYLESKGIDLETAKALRSASVTLSINGGFDVNRLIENKEGILKDKNIIKALEKLGFESDIFETGNNEKMREFVQKVNELGSARYSDIPEVDSDMRKLSRFVSQYRRDLEQERKKEIKSYNLEDIQYLEGEEFNQALSEEAWRRAYAREGANATPEKARETAESYYNKFRAILDNGGENWILNKTKETDVVWALNERNLQTPGVDRDLHAAFLDTRLFNENSSVEASRNSDAKIVSLGIQPSDWVVIHEFIHAIEDAGFQRGDGKLSKEQAPYSNHLRQHEMFDEVCVDYFAKLIYEARIAKGKDPILNQTPFTSSYSSLFPIMAPFIERMMPDIKAAKMVEKENPGKGFKRVSNIVKSVFHKEAPDPTPASFFGSLIGKENFEQLSLLCNEIVSLYYPGNRQELEKTLKENYTELHDVLEGAKKDLSFLTGIVINDQDMAKLEQEKGKRGIFDLIRSVRRIPEVTKEAVQERDQTMIGIKYVVDNPELEKWAEIVSESQNKNTPVQNAQNQPVQNVPGSVQNTPGVATVPTQGTVSQPVQQNPGYQTPSSSVPTPPVRNDNMVM